MHGGPSRNHGEDIVLLLAVAVNHTGPVMLQHPGEDLVDIGGSLEVETGYCNYFSVVQNTKTTLNKGDNIHLVLWHGQLYSDEPAEAHVALTVGGTVIWQEIVGIPNKAGIYDINFPSVVSADAGTAIEYHLHNHGFNTWTLLSLDVEH